MFALLDQTTTEPAARARATAATPAELDDLADRFGSLYRTADPATLLTPVAAHVRMVSDALTREQNPDDRRRLLRNRARVAILAGRLAGDDLGDSMSARAYYALAVDSATEAGHHALAAIAHCYAAELAAAEHLTAAALDHLAAADQHAQHAPAIRSWLATIEATVHADRGDHQTAAEALTRAQDAYDRSTTDATLAWFEDDQTARLTAATGHLQLRSGTHTAARASYAEAIAQLHPTDRRHRVQCLIGQATAELHAGDPGVACRLAAQAADLLGRTPYATGTASLRAFRATAERPLGTRALRALDQQLAHLAA
ncbi:MAG TPA: hypothetical protein VLJ59_18965 [Mycobacteriales bacterium]|nr:hypothetical protein [Mycobacteriales bacterium]